MNKEVECTLEISSSEELKIFPAFRNFSFFLCSLRSAHFSLGFCRTKKALNLNF